MKKRFMTLVALCITGTILLTGCGNDSKETEKVTETAAADVVLESEEESAAAAETAAESETEAAESEASAPVDKVELTLATGGETGTYYAVGNVMATTLNPLLSYSDIKVVVSGGSQDDIIRIEDGEAHLGTVQNDVMSYAMNGTDTFEELGACTNFRAVAGLYDETCQIISTNPDIKTVSDLKGKTVSVGDAGSGVEFNARQILEAYDLTFDDITPVNSSFGDSASSLKDGKIDAAFITAGAPTVAVTDLATTNDVNVVAIDDEHAAKLVEEHPFYTQTTIPGGTYKGSDEDVSTVSVRATLIASADLSDDVVYELTKALFENQETMAAAHAKFEELSVESALNGIDVEFHPGAQKYYEEVGAWK
ncbi:MAG: TAXI family TRAP transporter solute-binding subunit [Eubacteriales bacterium]|nr:TAXI family TRAP transporter solute-binding subunit [Eubacteriales bacterium]